MTSRKKGLLVLEVRILLFPKQKLVIISGAKTVIWDARCFHLSALRDRSGTLGGKRPMMGAERRTTWGLEASFFLLWDVWGASQKLDGDFRTHFLGFPCFFGNFGAMGTGLKFNGFTGLP